jgi:phosphoenolpyruvate synthase/pyruvate phosphate dikinase
MGTAVNVQAMVFGNMGDDSGTGVLFTRNPSTGENKIMGEFLQNAQGEDVVAGIRTPVNFDKMADLSAPWPKIYDQIAELCDHLEQVYVDMVDIEFTVQKGELFLLQSRTGKRSAAAAFQIATDLVNEEWINWKEALKRLTPEQYRVVKRPIIDPSFKDKPELVGLPACPGVVTGKPVFSSHDAVNCTEPCILVTHETTPDDIAGMNAAVGILTQTGGATSHAAVVARAMDKACVVGCTDMSLPNIQGVKRVTIDGSTGRVWLDKEVPVVDSSQMEAVKTVGYWCCGDMNAFPGTPLFDLTDQDTQVIQVAHWWGHKEVIESLLEDLSISAVKDLAILDLRSPEQLMPEQDLGLVDVFGFNPFQDDFRTVLMEALYAKREELAGLRVMGLTNAEKAVMNAAGFHVLGAGAEPVVVPVDYAVFSTLSQSS